MSGHSKWSTIKHKKGILDAKKGVLFTKLSREITVAAKSGDADPELNFRLRLAIDNAKSQNMPKDNIERAIAKGSGTGAAGDSFEEITYEGIGPGGVGIIIQTLTDNKNRSAATVRSTITRAGGTFASTGAVSWNFEQKGQIVINVTDGDPEMIALESIDDGAEDFDVFDNTVEITCQYSDLSSIQKKIADKESVTLEKAEIALVPNSTVELDKEQTSKTLRLLDDLEELDDVQKVFSNADFNEEALGSYAE
jgi:YebC/PmpR family DNA-binding regulatory protein